MRFLFIPFLFLVSLGHGISAEKPNIVWIVSEDNSKHYLKLFDENGAETPNIAKLAEEGLKFTRAFSNSPVCSVARTTLATGCFGPRIGTQFHRRSKMANMPEGLRMFPAYLRDAGYYTTNNSKEDYNAIKSKDVWDDSSGKATWRNRAEKGQPFFHMESHSHSHEGRLHFSKADFENKKTTHDPAKVTLPPYFPDTELFRYTYAHYLDCIQTIDGIVGDTVAKLEEDGVLENTIIFYFGDHGGVLPRSKGYIYESGLHVPLVVRVPEKWKGLVGEELGTTVDDFVSFIDFGPTVLNLAGVKVPEKMDGRPFLGNGAVAGNSETFGYADRFDEKYDQIRSVRVGDLKYIRNYQAYYPAGLQNNYRYKMLAYTEWRDLYKEGKLGADQRLFYQAKSVEGLYDLSTDPHEVNNLASDPEYAEKLAELREKVSDWVKSMPDLSFFPESVLYSEAMDNPVAFGQKNKARIAEMVDVADLAVLPFAEASEKLSTALGSDDPMVRYWAATTCANFGKGAADLASEAEPLLKDEDAMVRMRAAEFFGIIGTRDPRSTLVELVNATNHPVEAMSALNSVVFFHDGDNVSYPFDPKSFIPKVREGDFQRRIDYLNGDPYPPKPRKTKKKK